MQSAHFLHCTHNLFDSYWVYIVYIYKYMYTCTCTCIFTYQLFPFLSQEGQTMDLREPNPFSGDEAGQVASVAYR